jgi:hypothetical protein
MRAGSASRPRPVGLEEAMGSGIAVPHVDSVSTAEASRQPHGFVAYGRTELDEAGELPHRVVHA